MPIRALFHARRRGGDDAASPTSVIVTLTRQAELVSASMKTARRELARQDERVRMNARKENA
jgi:hypothetical protein